MDDLQEVYDRCKVLQAQVELGDKPPPYIHKPVDPFTNKVGMANLAKGLGWFDD